MAEPEPEPEGEKKKMPMVLMERVERILETTERLNEKGKLNNEEFVDLCEDICKIRNKINYVKLKKITMVTNIYYKCDHSTCNEEKDRFEAHDQISGIIFAHSYKKELDSDEEEFIEDGCCDCCQAGKIRKIVISKNFNVDTIVLRVEEREPFRGSIGSTYIEEPALKVIKREGVFIDGNAIYSFISHM
jgi:hypothetical protein